MRSRAQHVRDSYRTFSQRIIHALPHLCRHVSMSQAFQFCEEKEKKKKEAEWKFRMTCPAPIQAVDRVSKIRQRKCNHVFLTGICLHQTKSVTMSSILCEQVCLLTYETVKYVKWLLQNIDPPTTVIFKHGNNS